MQHDSALRRASSTIVSDTLEGLKPGDEQYSQRTQSFLSYLETREPPVPTFLQIGITSAIGASSIVRNTTLGRVLFLVYSDSAFYDTRMRWVRDTWAKAVPESRLVVIGDAEAPADFGMRVHTTKCPQHSHGEGACCKYGEAVIQAHDMMIEDPDIKWAFFTDDDAYVRSEAMEQALLLQDAEGDDATVLGNFGCNTQDCPEVGLCAGGGYAASRRAVSLLIGNSAADFVREQMDNCKRCNIWADIALSQAFRAHQLEMKPQQGLYGWRLTKDKFDESLNDEPLMYHYIKSCSMTFSRPRIPQCPRAP